MPYQRKTFKLADPDDAKNFRVGSTWRWPPGDPVAIDEDSDGSVVVSAVDYDTGVITFASCGPVADEE